jgi:hypothetical protein
METAADELELNYDLYYADFNDFFPDLRRFVEAQLNKF